MDERLQRVNPSFTPVYRALSPPTRGISPLAELFADTTMSLPSRKRRLSDEIADSDMSSQEFELLYGTIGDNSDRINMRHLEDYGPYATAPPRSNTMSPAKECDTIEFQREDSSDCDDYDSILQEAVRLFQTSKKPPFCVNARGEDIKEAVHTLTGDIVHFSFQNFNNTEWGFWKYTNENGDPCIVKHKKGFWYTWLGQEVGCSKTPIASVVNHDGATRQHAHKQDVTPSARNMRKRTIRQEQPYAVDKQEQQMIKQGKAHTESDIEHALKNTQKNTTKKTATTTTLDLIAKKRKASDMSDTPESVTISDTFCKAAIAESTTFETMLFESTTLRTRFHEIQDAAIPVYLTRGETVRELLNKIEANWKFQLGNRAMDRCIVRFPWSDEKANILLHHGTEDGLRKLIEEVRHAPIWNEKRCEVDVEIMTNVGRAADDMAG